MNCFLGNASGVFAGTLGGIYFSSNKGSSWNTKNVFLQNKNVKSLCLMGTIIVAGTKGGVFLSENNGNSWQDVNNGLSYMGIQTLEIEAITVKDGILFAGTNSHGVYSSSDTGKTWSNNGNAIFGVKSLLVKDNLLLAGTNGAGIFASSDLGLSWNNLPTITDNYVNALAVNNGFVYAGTSSGVYFSRNNGTSWTRLYDSLQYFNVNSIAGNGSFILAGLSIKGIAKANVDGTALRFIRKGLYNIWIKSLAVSKSSIFAISQGEIFMSADKGESWSLIPKGIITSPYSSSNPFLNTLASDETTILLGSSKGIFRFNKPDNTWKVLNKDLQSFQIQHIDIKQNRIVAASYSKIYISADSGKVWKDVTFDLPVTTVTSVLLHDTSVFAGTFQGLYVLNKGSWKPFSKGLSNSGLTHALARDGKDIYMAQSSSLYALNWKDSSWNNLPITGKFPFNIGKILPVGDKIFAATTVGIYEYSKKSGTGEYTSQFINQTSTAMAVIGTDVFTGTSGSGAYRTGVSIITEIDESTSASSNTKSVIWNVSDNMLRIKLSEDFRNVSSIVLYDYQGKVNSAAITVNEDEFAFPRTIPGIFCENFKRQFKDCL